jgi:hypothetical protein
MSSRYDDSIELLNNEESYKSYFRDRNRPPGVYSSGIKYIIHYSTPELRHPSEFEIAGLQNTAHVWNRGDKFYKLAYDVGNVIYIPQPFEKIMQYLGV